MYFQYYVFSVLGNGKTNAGYAAVCVDGGKGIPSNRQVFHDRMEFAHTQKESKAKLVKSRLKDFCQSISAGAGLDQFYVTCQATTHRNAAAKSRFQPSLKSTDHLEEPLMKVQTCLT